MEVKKEDFASHLPSRLPSFGFPKKRDRRKK